MLEGYNLEVTSNSGCNELESRQSVKSLEFSSLSAFVILLIWCCIIPVLVTVLSAVGTTSRTNLVTIFVWCYYV